MKEAQHTHELALDLPAAHRGVRVARHMVRHFARLEGVGERELEPLVLVVSELLANAIDHTGGPVAMTEAEMNGNKRMRLSCVVRSGGWLVTVSDEGGGDPEALRARFAPEGMPDLEDERGRGLFLMAQMVDRIEVRRSVDGRGLTVVASKERGG